MPFLIAATVISIIVAVYCICSKKKIDSAVIVENDKLLEQHKKLVTEYNELDNRYTTLNTTYTDLISVYRTSEEKLDRINFELKETSKSLDLANKSLENQEKVSKQAYEQYCKTLELCYENAEQEYEKNKRSMSDAYNKLQQNLMEETIHCQEELDKAKATRLAIIEAQRREKEIEANLAFHSITISEADKNDIAKLESLKPSLNKPRVLSMLIWQTYVQKPLKLLSANVGALDKMGIYKITNIKTKECYVGQAVDIGTRWSEHCKCALGIDTPAGNKLYAAMQEYGVWNFTFEVLEICSREQLNEKEKKYIDLYDSYNSGYNSNKGIGK